MGSRTSSPGTQTLPAATDLCPAQARAKCCIASTILRMCVVVVRHDTACAVKSPCIFSLRGGGIRPLLPLLLHQITFLKAFLNVYMCLEGAMNS